MVNIHEHCRGKNVKHPLINALKNICLSKPGNFLLTPFKGVSLVFQSL